jgi:hypothetical protein
MGLRKDSKHPAASRRAAHSSTPHLDRSPNTWNARSASSEEARGVTGLQFLDRHRCAKTWTSWLQSEQGLLAAALGKRRKGRAAAGEGRWTGRRWKNFWAPWGSPRPAVRASDRGSCCGEEGFLLPCLKGAPRGEKGAQWEGARLLELRRCHGSRRGTGRRLGNKPERARGREVSSAMGMAPTPWLEMKLSWENQRGRKRGGEEGCWWRLEFFEGWECKIASTC